MSNLVGTPIRTTPTTQEAQLVHDVALARMIGDDRYREVARTALRELIAAAGLTVADTDRLEREFENWLDFGGELAVLCHGTDNAIMLAVMQNNDRGTVQVTGGTDSAREYLSGNRAITGLEMALPRLRRLTDESEPLLADIGLKVAGMQTMLLWRLLELLAGLLSNGGTIDTAQRRRALAAIVQMYKKVKERRGQSPWDFTFDMSNGERVSLGLQFEPDSQISRVDGIGLGIQVRDDSSPLVKTMGRQWSITGSLRYVSIGEPQWLNRRDTRVERLTVSTPSSRLAVAIQREIDKNPDPIKDGNVWIGLRTLGIFWAYTAAAGFLLAITGAVLPFAPRWGWSPEVIFAAFVLALITSVAVTAYGMFKAWGYYHKAWAIWFSLASPGWLLRPGAGKLHAYWLRRGYVQESVI
jgi:hypothetical protein